MKADTSNRFDTLVRRFFNGLYRTEWLLVLLIFSGSLAIRAYVLHLPGPSPDELLYVSEAERLRVGDPLWAASFQIAGHSLPAGLDGYQGGFPIYIHWLVSHLTDYPLRFRVINILYAVAMIGFTYFFAREFISKRAALLSALFLATLPSQVFFSRIGEMAIFLRVTLASAALYYFYRWAAHRSWGAFYAGCLALGLGISTRLEIVWWLVAALLYLILLDHARLRQVVSHLWSYKGRALIGVTWFLIGGGLFIVYNVVTHGWTIVQITQSLVLTPGGHSNLAVFANFNKRVKHLLELLDGSSIHGMTSSYRNTLFSLAFGVAFLSLFVVSVLARLRRRPDRKGEFLLFMLILMLLQSTFSVSRIDVIHLLVLMPIPILILVKFLDLIPFRALISIVVVVLVAGNLWVDVRYYNRLLRAGSWGIFSPRAYSLVGELDRLGVPKVITCDWGLANLVYYFSKGRIKVKEIFGYSHDVPASFYLALAAAVQEPSTSFLFYASPYSAFKRERAFLDYLRERGLAYQQWVFYDNYGPIYLLYQVPRQDRPVDRVAESGGAAGFLAGRR